MKKIISIFVLLPLLLTACSDDEGKAGNKPGGDHVWKDQTDTMEKARAVEGILEDAAKEQQEMIEQNTQ